MAELILTSIRAHNIHPGATAHITGKSHTYVVFSVGNVEQSTSVVDGEASSVASWNDTVRLSLNSASGDLKVTVYNKRKLIHDHEIGSSHIDLSHHSKAPGAEVRMVLMGKGQQQGELSFLPELKHSGGATRAAPAIPAGGLAAGGGAAAGHPNHGNLNLAARRGATELSPEVNHGPGLGGSSTLAMDKAAVTSGAAEPASKGGYASHVAAPGATAAGATGTGTPALGTPALGTPAGHGDFVDHDKPAGTTAGFGGGGAAVFDNRGLPTGKAHLDNQPAARWSGAPGAYGTSGSSATDPSADLTNPVGDRSMQHSGLGLGTGTGLATGAGLGTGLGALAGEHKDGDFVAHKDIGIGTHKDTDFGAHKDSDFGAHKDTYLGAHQGTGASAGAPQGRSMLGTARDYAAGAADKAKVGGAYAADKAKEGAGYARDVAAGAAGAVTQGAYDLKDRMTGSGQQDTAKPADSPASGTTTTHVGAPLSVGEVEHTGTHAPGAAAHTSTPLSGMTEHSEFESALEPVTGGAQTTAEGEHPSLLGRAQGLASSAVGAVAGTASSAVQTVAGAPRAAYNTATGVTQSAYNTAAGATQAVYQRVAGSTPSTTGEHITTTKTEHDTEGAKSTLTERAKGLTANAIDTTTHLLDQAKLHVTGHGTGEPVEAPKTIGGTAMAYTGKAIDMTTNVLDYAKEKIVGGAGGASPTTTGSTTHTTTHTLREQ